MTHIYYNDFLDSCRIGNKSLAILIDPDKFNISQTERFMEKIPSDTTHIFVGGSRVTSGNTKAVVHAVKTTSSLPVFLFPGDYNQITSSADALLFLSLLSGRNSEYLIGQQVKSVPALLKASIEIIPTGYLLLDGGNVSAVERVTNTFPMTQDDVISIVNTAIAGQYMGARLIYLEAGSGAKQPVKTQVIKQVKQAIDIPLLVGGGIRTEKQKQAAYNAGADLVVMGTVFETDL